MQPDPYLPRKIATCTTVEELDALVAAFGERGDTFPAECRGGRGQQVA